VVVRFGGCVEADVAAGQTRFHFQHGGFGHAQVLRDLAHFLHVHPAEALLGLAQVEEQLALRLGGGNFHDAPVAQDEFVHLGANPVHREADQSHAVVGIETLDGLHQADVAFLDQVGHLQAVAGITARDVHHETQVRHHQLARRIEVFLVAVAVREIPFFLDGQHRNAMHRADVRIETTDYAGNGQAVGDQGFTHWFYPTRLYWHSNYGSANPS